jgi:hypothetical protein
MQTKLSEKEVLAMWRKLERDCDIRRTMNRQNLILWYRAGVISSASGGGGWGRRKEFPPETPAEIFATATVIDALRLTLAQIRTVRDLALILERAPNFTPENSKSEIERLSRAFIGQDFYVAGIVGWLRAKNLALQHLYDDGLTDRQKFFETESFKLFLIGLVGGLYRGYSVNDRGEAVKPADAPEPGDALRTFATAGTETAAAPLAARGRE